MSTVAGGSSELLKNELKKRFHLIAHSETRDTDVLLLKVQNPNPPGLKPSRDDNQNSEWIGETRKITIRNEQLDGFFNFVESRVGLPVLNEAGLKGRYDLQMQWQPEPGESDKHAFVRALRDQLGLELVPTNMPVDMLVVENAK